MGKKHSTIGRWEKGEVPFTLADLQKLAEIYQVTPAQLMAAPEMASFVQSLDRAQKIISNMGDEDRERWLSIGESLAHKK